VDVYYDEDWHHVYEGDTARLEWVEKNIPDGQKSVTAARFRTYKDTTSSSNTILYEFDFWEVEAVAVPIFMNAYRRLREE